MKVYFWNTRGDKPLFYGPQEIEFRGMVSATIPLPPAEEMPNLVLINEFHHDVDGRAEEYNPDRKFATVKKVVVDRKHGPPKLRYYFR